MADRLKIQAVVLAAGSGSRMHSNEKKQFMTVNGLPVIDWSLLAFEENPAVDGIVVVAAEEDTERTLQLCRELKVSKVRNIVTGGDLRFRSVYNGLLVLPSDTDYVLIHDAARPMITQEIIRNCISGAVHYKACAAAVKEKNTVKRADSSGFAVETLDRSSLYEIQTPQAFSYRLILEAYYRLQKTIQMYNTDVSFITDDAVIVENMTDTRVALVEGSYRNLKITTPEDLILAEALLKHPQR